MGIILSQEKYCVLQQASTSLRSSQIRYSHALCSRSWSQTLRMTSSYLHHYSNHHYRPSCCWSGCLCLPCVQPHTQPQLHRAQRSSLQVSIPGSEAGLCHMCSCLAVLGSRTVVVGHRSRFLPNLHHRLPSQVGHRQRRQHLLDLDPTAERCYTESSLRRQ